MLLLSFRPFQLQQVVFMSKCPNVLSFFHVISYVNNCADRQTNRSVSHWEISWDVILSKCCSLLSPLSSLIYLLYGSFISPLFPTLGSLSSSLSQLSASSSVILLSVSYSPLLLHLLSLSSSLLPVSSLNIYLSCFTAVSLSLSICCYFSILSSSLRSFLSSYFPLCLPPLGPTSAQEMRTRMTQGKKGFLPVLTTSCTSWPSSGRSCLLVFLPRTTWMAGRVSPSLSL